MSTHNIGFYEDLTKIIFELSSNIIKYASYIFCCLRFVSVSWNLTASRMPSLDNPTTWTSQSLTGGYVMIMFVFKLNLRHRLALLNRSLSECQSLKVDKSRVRS